MECSIDDCDLPVRCRGWCSPHYMRWYLHGDPLAGGSLRPSRRGLPPIECCLEGCTQRRASKDGLCKNHAVRKRRNGDPTIQMPRGKPRTYCKVEGCARNCAGDGYCGAHYYRWKRYGDPLAVPIWGSDWQSRFWSHVTKNPDPGCWIYDTESGYATFDYTEDGERYRNAAHRLAYELEVGPIPEGLVLDHLCTNTRCVKPAHLEPVTTRENLERGWLRKLGLRVDVLV